ncbi:thermonuclease family protein [Agromyces sp. MMS24-JH15]|uniref:thermonuclease family protein n=1 Tax=Agromyces sp. MMS24-JH15 TaxID=3243765 RepID=UPI00374962DE
MKALFAQPMRSAFALPDDWRGALLLIVFWWPLVLVFLAVLAMFRVITTTGVQRELPQRKGLFLILTAIAVAATGMRIALSTVASQRDALDTAGVETSLDWLVFVVVAAVAMLAVLGLRRIVSRRRTMSPEEHRRYTAEKDQKPEWLYWPGQPVPRREPQRLRDLPVFRLYERRPKTTMAVIGAGVVVLMTAGSLSLSAVPTWAQEAEVVSVVDGDTVDVRIDGQKTRVRILNMNAPEDNAVTGESECLGPEATAALETLLPTGSLVDLAYDEVRHDRYGRLLAKVTTADGTSAGSAMISQGLAVPAEYGDNVRYLGESNNALSQAEEAEAGIFSPAVECSPMAEIEALQTAAAPVVAPTERQSSADLVATTGAVAAVIATIAATNAAADAIDWVTPDIHNRWLRDIAAISARMTTYQNDAATFTPIAVAREAEAARLAAEAAAAAAAAQAEAERVAEANRLAEEQRQAEAARQAQEPAAESSSGSNGGSSSSGGYDGYTGCRAYGSGGTSIDEKGRRYTKIDCTTKLPL